MNYRKLLTTLFFVEMVIGTFIVGYASGFDLLTLTRLRESNYVLMALGASVFLAHAVEYLMLTKVKT